MKKRVIAGLLAGVMMFVLCACTTTEVKDEISAQDGRLFSDDVTIKWMIPSHASWPYNENWKVWEYIREVAGGNIEITAIPAVDYVTKLTLMMADSKNVPDMLTLDGAWTSVEKNFALQGAYVSFDDNLDKLPNYCAYVDTLSEEEIAQSIDTRRWADGKLYLSPIFGADEYTNVRSWLYRKDIFEKHNLKQPETMEDLYEVCLELKQLYPESYPFSLRNGLTNIDVIGSSFKPYFTYGVYYDFNSDKWCYGAREDTMLEYLTFMKKMFDEELVAPDYTTMSLTSWQELVSTNRGFIMADYHVRLDYFNKLARANNPDFKMDVMVPPKANNETGSAMVSRMNGEPSGTIVLNTRNQENIANSFKLLDWFYSDEGAELMSWGKEGETFETSDGKKRYLLEESESKSAKYGLQSYGTYTRISEDAASVAASDEANATRALVFEHTVPYKNPTMWLAFTEEQDARISDITTSLTAYTEENIVKFLIGQRPLSEWDEFQADLKDMNIDELLAIYDESYKAALGK